ncbi:MAG: hypothetical protein JWR15_1126 [Prosthecobacter sp.]|nr:hypothetical protein [Prosthecobacter sp.]
MKYSLLLLALIGLVAFLSACAHPPRVQWVRTGQVIHSAPGIIGPLYTINGVALQQYSPSLYTPFVYDHRGLVDNQFYHDQAVRHAAGRRGTVHVGPLTPLVLRSAANPAPGYEVRRAVVVR